MADQKEKSIPLRVEPEAEGSPKEMSKLAERLGVDKPPKVERLDPEKSVPVLHPPRPGDPEAAIRELEEMAEQKPPEKEEEKIREMPEEHMTSLEEAIEKLPEK